MVLEASSPHPAEFQVPQGLEDRALALEQLAAEVRAGADPAEAIARVALILAADQRNQSYD